MTARRLRDVLLVGLSAAALAVVPTAPAGAGDFDRPPSSPPQSTSAPQHGTASPAGAPTKTCSIYGSSSGFGMLCSDAAVGKTLAQLFREAGIDVDKAFCWDDVTPDGFEPEKPQSGPGAWWLNTCLEFDGAILKSNARLTFEYTFHQPGDERRLEPDEERVIRLVTGRGQIPFLQVQTTPVSSPRVDQDVAFSMLCDAKVRCSDTAAGREIVTPSLTVGPPGQQVTMFARLVHLRVLPEGAAQPDKVVDCTGAGLPRTAEELDAGPNDDPRVCRYRYLRSSNEAGGGSSGDRYPARVTAYWQIYVDEGNGPRAFGRPYEKTTVNSIRVTEVQTLVVS